MTLTAKEEKEFEKFDKALRHNMKLDIKIEKLSDFEKIGNKLAKENKDSPDPK